MKWQIFSIGSPSLDYAKRGVEEYSRRMRRYAKLDLVHAKEAGREKNSRYLLHASEGSFRIALDERGDSLTTKAFAGEVAKWRNSGLKRISFLVGGADGHDREVREQSDLTWSLSSFTLQHELALVVLLEQIYRVHTLLRGEPYHRE